MEQQSARLVALIVLKTFHQCNASCIYSYSAIYAGAAHQDCFALVSSQELIIQLAMASQALIYSGGMAVLRPRPTSPEQCSGPCRETATHPANALKSKHARIINIDSSSSRRIIVSSSLPGRLPPATASSTPTPSATIASALAIGILSPLPLPLIVSPAIFLIPVIGRVREITICDLLLLEPGHGGPVFLGASFHVPHILSGLGVLLGICVSDEVGLSSRRVDLGSIASDIHRFECLFARLTTECALTLGLAP